MPEIAMLYVYEWTNEDGPSTISIGDVGGDAVLEDTTEFDVSLLAEIGADNGISRWSEPTADERAEHHNSSYVAEKLTLIGWAEAPIARDDVETHSDMSRPSRPAVNIKVHSTDLPKGEPFLDLLEEFEGDMDPKLAKLDPTQIRDLLDDYIAKTSHVFDHACDVNFESAKDQIIELFDHKVSVYAEGRSGGWLVIDGLPDVDTWGVDLLTKWQQVVEICKAEVADIPRAMGWQALANCQADLAGRVVHVALTFVLSDTDLDELGVDPSEWDWRGMLDLGVDSEIRVHRPSDSA